MSKLLQKTILAFVAVVFVISIVNLALNAVIYKKQRDNEKDEDDRRTTTATTTSTVKPTYTTGTPSTNTHFKEAADILLRGLDTKYDPCENFYMFSCGKYLDAAVIPDSSSRIGTYDETQRSVNSAVARRLNGTANGKFASSAENILQKVFSACMANTAIPSPVSKVDKIYKIIVDNFNGFPMLEAYWPPINSAVFWKGVGSLERNNALGTLLNSFVSVDYKNISRNTMFINQIVLNMARDYYIKPQFIADLDGYFEDVFKTIKRFAKDLKRTTSDEMIRKQLTLATVLEKKLAGASLSDEELRNVQDQYNLYTLQDLKQMYPAVGWSEYLKALLQREVRAEEQFVITQPSYVAALNAHLASAGDALNDFVNLVSMRLIVDNAIFLSKDENDEYRKISIKIKQLNVQNDEWEDRAYGCVSVTIDYMPFATGYTYLQTIPENDRNAARQDIELQTKYVIEEFLKMIGTLQWLTNVSYENAKKKSEGMIRNYGWPEFYEDFKNTTLIDKYHSHYTNVNNLEDWFDILMELKKAYQITELFELYDKQPDRTNFLMSPALVNAWYQPERNSITLPYASLNPPYYNLRFPQAYNYAGQAGTAGHELTHGYDDGGVQFGADGVLGDCTWDKCGWMDTNSSAGFLNMAQCVITQFSQNCCPLKSGNVQCASGERTQGENIADLGGELAAYRAYRRYVAEQRQGVEEDALPGLEQFTPNQIFWLTYGYSWCMKYRDETLIRQLLTDPHSPGECRVNEVLRDIPEFAADFNCKRGSYMYPEDNQRCHVWIR